MARLQRGKKRKAIPNPNRRFITLSKALAAGKATSKATPQGTDYEATMVEFDKDEESETASVIKVKVGPGVAHLTPPKSPYLTTRSGRVVKKNRRLKE